MWDILWHFQQLMQNAQLWLLRMLLCSTLLPTPTSRLQTSAPMQCQESNTQTYGFTLPWMRFYVCGCMFPTCQHGMANIPMLPCASPLHRCRRAAGLEAVW